MLLIFDEDERTFPIILVYEVTKQTFFVSFSDGINNFSIVSLVVVLC